MPYAVPSIYNTYWADTLDKALILWISCAFPRSPVDLKRRKSWFSLYCTAWGLVVLYYLKLTPHTGTLKLACTCAAAFQLHPLSCTALDQMNSPLEPLEASSFTCSQLHFIQLSSTVGILFTNCSYSVFLHTQLIAVYVTKDLSFFLYTQIVQFQSLLWKQETVGWQDCS